jgi:hypothetical protein
VKLGLLALAAAALLSGGCGSGPHGTATLWVTRDRGARVLLTRKVPAGLTAMQALDRVADIKTRYGGRFVQAIDGVSGSLSARRDWFYFINGYEADRGAAEYRLRDGDVEWWDYRSWGGRSDEPVVVGAFPEPFLHGYGGRRRPAYVVGPVPSDIAKRVHGRVVAAGAPIPRSANVLTCGTSRSEARFRFDGGVAGDPAVVTVDCATLSTHPDDLRFHYSLP